MGWVKEDGKALHKLSFIFAVESVNLQFKPFVKLLLLDAYNYL